MFFIVAQHLQGFTCKSNPVGAGTGTLLFYVGGVLIFIIYSAIVAISAHTSIQSVLFIGPEMFNISCISLHDLASR